MKINHLSLKQFRNIEVMEAKFHPNLNVFIGDNGQGKTNVIEAIALLSLGHSFRVSDDKVLIQNNCDFAKITAEFEAKGQIQKLDMVVSSKGKYIVHNNQVLPRLSDLIGLSNVIVFSPEDLNFFTNSPRFRRAELDYEIGKLSKDYMVDLTSHRRLLQERNALLKSDGVNMDLLAVIDDQMSDVSLRIIEFRSKFVKLLSTTSSSLYQFLSESTDLIHLDYKTFIDPDNMSKEAILEKVQSSLKRDLDFKTSHVGIHRDDYVYTINEDLVIHRASQGQRRLIMLAYKFALVQIIERKLASSPIICLDDLFSELDAKRRSMIFKLFSKEQQVFITTTDRNFIESHNDKHVYTVIKGIVNKEAI